MKVLFLGDCEMEMLHTLTIPFSDTVDDVEVSKIIKFMGEGNFILKAKRGFGQGFPNWLKLSNMLQQSPSNRNKLVDNKN